MYRVSPMYVSFRGQGLSKDILILSHLNICHMLLHYVSIYMTLFIDVLIICNIQCTGMTY